MHRSALDVNESTARQHFQFFSPATYLLELRTSIALLPRQSGKSQAIALEARPGDIIVYPNLRMRDYAKKEFGQHKGVITTSVGSDTNGLRGLSLPDKFTIWFDEVRPGDIIRWVREAESTLAGFKAFREGNVVIMGASTLY